MQPTGDEIRKARDALGLSRPKLAAQIEGVSTRTLARAENDEEVSDRTLEAIARHLRLGDYRAAGPTIREATEVELAEELLRRARERQLRGGSAPGLRSVAPPSDENGYLTEAARRRRPLRDLDEPDTTEDHRDD